MVCDAAEPGTLYYMNVPQGSLPAFYRDTVLFARASMLLQIWRERFARSVHMAYFGGCLAVG